MSNYPVFISLDFNENTSLYVNVFHIEAVRQEGRTTLVWCNGCDEPYRVNDGVEEVLAAIEKATHPGPISTEPKA